MRSVEKDRPLLAKVVEHSMQIQCVKNKGQTSLHHFTGACCHHKVRLPGREQWRRAQSKQRIQIFALSPSAGMLALSFVKDLIGA
jgi:hypothetical protein